LTPDAFNHSLIRGQEEPFTAGDLTLMDVIGYDPAAVPEPTTLAILTTCLIVLGALRRHLTQPPSGAWAARIGRGERHPIVKI
jgi:hypothetical protein